MTHFLFDDCLNSVSAGSLRNPLPQARIENNGIFFLSDGHS